MNKFIWATITGAVLSATLMGQSPQSTGKWQDVSKDSTRFFMNNNGTDSTTRLLVSEDYEVLQTHEICASVYGYFMEKSQVGRYDVNFKGMRTGSTFTFTTQYDAEHWVQKWCTPQSLLQIKAGRGEFARKY
jgi:hypothetical protein